MDGLKKTKEDFNRSANQVGAQTCVKVDEFIYNTEKLIQDRINKIQSDSFKSDKTVFTIWALNAHHGPLLPMPTTSVLRPFTKR